MLQHRSLHLYAHYVYGIIQLSPNCVAQSQTARRIIFRGSVHNFSIVYQVKVRYQQTAHNTSTVLKICNLRSNLCNQFNLVNFHRAPFTVNSNLNFSVRASLIHLFIRTHSKTQQRKSISCEMYLSHGLKTPHFSQSSVF